MEIVKLTSVLELFFAFNRTEAKNSLSLEESDYDDKFFRWTKDSFKHKETLTVIYNKRRIVIFNTEKVRDRLGANMDKISNDETKTHFGCQFNIIADLVEVIHIEEISDDEVAKFNDELIKEREEYAKEKEKDERYGKVPVQNK